MSWVLIDSDEQLHTALDSLAGAREIAVDTEFMRRNTYYPQIALLQLCAGDSAWLIDPLSIGDTARLRALLTDPAVYKVLHSCSEDLEVFRHWLKVLPEPLIDTQRAAALLGEDYGLGYRAVVERLLGIELEKGETRSDWLRRPLSESQCHYAAQDVLELLRVWAVLRERAEAQGRLPWILEEGLEAARALAARDKDPYRRIKSASRLTRRQLAALRALADWREALARKSDKPRGWILDDKTCLAIAGAMPETQAQLAAVETLPPAVLRRRGDALLGCVAAARALPEAELPPVLPGPLPSQLRARLKTLRGSAREIAARLEVAPELLLSGADLELLLRQWNGEHIEEPERWQGWRNAAVIAPLRGVLGDAA